MLNKKTVMRAAGAAFVGMVLLTGQLASAQSDSARIENRARMEWRAARHASTGIAAGP